MYHVIDHLPTWIDISGMKQKGWRGHSHVEIKPKTYYVGHMQISLANNVQGTSHRTHIFDQIKMTLHEVGTLSYITQLEINFVIIISLTEGGK